MNLLQVKAHLLVVVQVHPLAIQAHFNLKFNEEDVFQVNHRGRSITRRKILKFVLLRLAVHLHSNFTRHVQKTQSFALILGASRGAPTERALEQCRGGS